MSMANVLPVRWGDLFVGALWDILASISCTEAALLDLGAGGFISSSGFGLVQQFTLHGVACLWSGIVSDSYV